MTTPDTGRATLSKRAGYILFAEGPDQPAATARETVVLLDALTAAERRATRAEAQSETRRQQTAYWQERAEMLEAKVNELDRAYISERGQRGRAEDEQDRLKNKLARRSETVSRLLEERNNAEARIQAVRDLMQQQSDRAYAADCMDGFAAVMLDDLRRALDGDA